MKLIGNSRTSQAHGSDIQRQAPADSSATSSCWINGRQFVQRGTLWIDRSIENMPRARRVRIRFDSREYFQLISRYPKLFPCLSGARNVHVAVEDTVYEIYE